MAFHHSLPTGRKHRCIGHVSDDVLSVDLIHYHISRRNGQLQRRIPDNGKFQFIPAAKVTLVGFLLLLVIVLEGNHIILAVG